VTTPISNGSELLAEDLYTALIAGYDLDAVDIDIDDPAFDFPGNLLSALSRAHEPISLDDLTSGMAVGHGAIDRLISTTRAILLEEFNSQRLTQAEYTRALIELLGAAMENGVQFLLQRDSSYWQAVRSQIEAASGRINYETARLQFKMAAAELRNGGANFALTKIKLANEDAAFGAAKYQVDQMLPTQRKLVAEQAEAQRAQTLDTRTDGIPVGGNLGKQKELHSQQITSYQRDAEIKMARPFIDAWITQKTADEGLGAPNNFTNPQLDQILSHLRNQNGFPV
jgi:hypothetical protein